jgi:hypothetical protein
MNIMIKADKVVSTALGLLARELTLPALVWRDAGGDFAGAKDDTISIRLPAYANAKTRQLRSGSSRDRDNLNERKVDITLDTDVYKDVTITDEELTLDILDFGAQVLQPVTSSVARALEDVLVGTIQGANYETELELDETNPYTTIVAVRKALNDARVPAGGRALIVGSTIEAAFLNSEQFARADRSGSTAALRDASIGRVAGFEVVSCPALDPEEAYAFHKTAFVLSQRAPKVPNGAPYGASVSQDGMALRVIQVLDSETLNDILAVDAFVGANVVTDFGTLTDGIFAPSEGTSDSSDSNFDSGADDLFVRAVKITLGSSS